MENLYIKYDGAGFVDHPMLESNLLQVYPDIDLNNLPHGLAKFNRVEKPACGPYEVVVPAEGGVYAWEEVGKVAKDLWVIRPMTLDEKHIKIALVQLDWSRGPAFPSWTFDESTCRYNPPVAMPQDGKPYKWNEDTESWDLFNV